MATFYALIRAWLKSLSNWVPKCHGKATSTPAASQATCVPSDFVPCLPPELWVKIFQHLDIESLLNLAEAVPQWKHLAFSPAVIRSVTFNQGADERILKKFLLTERENLVPEKRSRSEPLALGVRELRLTNCIALPSKAIIDVTRRCYNLRELYCVNCVVEPYELFRHLCRLLQSIKKVEWTLYDTSRYRYENSLDVWRIERLHEGMGPSINEMYVEKVLCEATVVFLNSFLKRCRHLCHLHVHNVCTEYYLELDADDGSANFVPDKRAASSITDHLPTLQTYQCTFEMPLSPNMDSRLPVILYNIAWQWNGVVSQPQEPEPWFNVVRLDDVVNGEVALGGRQQVTLIVRGNMRVASLFEEAASKPESWKDVRRLTVVYVPSLTPNENSIPSSAVPRNSERPMRQFFDASVSRLTELNLSMSHFSIGCDCCHLVASTLHSLRSLSLPPCGANLQRSLAWLAQGCKLLESLDVRSVPTVNDAGCKCEACKRPLRFTASSLKLVHKETRLMQLTIDETAQISNLRFLRECRVARLSISVDNVKCGDFTQCPKVLGRLLASNHRLSSLTLVARGATLRPALAETLSRVKSLRRVCVLTTASVCSMAVVDFLLRLERGLPELLCAHVHYAGEEGVVLARTWLRRRRHDIPGHSSIPVLPSANGVVVYDRPCLSLLCCVDGFTGLVRPRNRS
ncbi:hypothetical protein HPB51_014959 [Rhipicephalus microplus]|uniref:F-box domain-containing protein n=1 Tax=Rhipicephalus microplus TaxID=6941 RepID=A0A9J6E173_RHIMP|nr:hypothetical protein HPB51_014959 [Rhipicephalus microplus]